MVVFPVLIDSMCKYRYYCGGFYTENE